MNILAATSRCTQRQLFARQNLVPTRTLSELSRRSGLLLLDMIESSREIEAIGDGCLATNMASVGVNNRARHMYDEDMLVLNSLESSDEENVSQTFEFSPLRRRGRSFTTGNTSMEEEIQPGAYAAYGRPIGYSTTSPRRSHNDLTTAPLPTQGYSSSPAHQRRTRNRSPTTTTIQPLCRGLGLTDRMSSRTFQSWLVLQQNSSNRSALSTSHAAASSYWHSSLLVIDASVRRLSSTVRQTSGGLRESTFNAIPPELRPVVEQPASMIMEVLEEEQGEEDVSAQKKKRGGLADISIRPRRILNRFKLAGLLGRGNPFHPKKRE